MRASPEIALFLVRVSFGIFIALWGLNKVLNPEASAAIFAAFYGFEGLDWGVSVVLGLGQVAIGLMIAVGLYATFSYGAGIVIHGVSTMATLGHLLVPFAEGSNLVFWAAVPVLAGALGLFLARDFDTFLSVDSRRRRASGSHTEQFGIGQQS